MHRVNGYWTLNNMKYLFVSHCLNQFIEAPYELLAFTNKELTKNRYAYMYLNYV